MSLLSKIASGKIIRSKFNILLRCCIQFEGFEHQVVFRAEVILPFQEQKADKVRDAFVDFKVSAEEDSDTLNRVSQDGELLSAEQIEKPL